MSKLFSKMFGGKKSSQDKDKDKDKDSAKIIIPRTEEFPYLPSYHWVKSTEFIPETSSETLAKAKYVIRNSKDTIVYEAYKAILIEDGWTITEETQVINFSAKKDTHIANISFAIFGDDVLITVESK